MATKEEVLTPAEEKLAAEIRGEYINRALNWKEPYNEEKIRENVHWLYEFSGYKKKPKVVLCGSPIACQMAANKEAGNATPQYYSFANLGLAFNSGWTAFGDFFQRTGHTVNPHFDKWLDFMKCGIWDCISFDTHCFVSMCPSKVLKDSNGMLHNDKGEAVLWPDGHKDYFVHSVNIPEYIITKPETITVKGILEQKNAEVRRVMIDKYGVAKFVEDSGAEVLDADKDAQGNERRLLRVELEQDEPVVSVQVKCPSTGRDYFIRVPPATKTASEAVAWTFGFSAKEYVPIKET